MEKILITGCAGFIGFHAVQKFAREGFRVLGVDDLNDHYDPLIKRMRLKYLQKNLGSSFIFKRTDIRDKRKVDGLIKKEKFRAVVNLAARAGVRNSVIDPWIYYQTNTIGVINILQALKEHQPSALLVQASTSSVYGDHEVPFREDDRVDHPLSPYAASKKASEEICYTYHYLYGMNVLVFRFFTVYGTFGRPDMCIFRFTKWIDEGKELILFGDGNQERDFTFVEDIVQAIFLALGFKGYDIVNLGNDSPTKINEVIRTIEERFSRKARIKNLPRHSADIMRTCAKIEKARRVLNWEPKTGIAKGLDIVLDWYQKEKSWLRKVREGGS